MGFINELVNFFYQAVDVFSSFRFVDFLDICLVTLVVYSAVKLMRETKAIQLLKGLILFVLIYIVISALNMQASKFIFQSVASNAIIVLVVLFTPEIRHALESLGRSSISSIGIFNSYGKNERIERNERIAAAIKAVCRACSDMSDKKIGALIVFERGTLLGEIVNTGTLVDAVVSDDIIQNIFYPKAPLHDGAAVLRENRVVAAGCILPLTQRGSLSRELGTRHRAGVGMSEESDAAVVIVSEETGYISVAFKGELIRDITVSDLGSMLTRYLTESEARTAAPTRKLKSLFKGGKKK